MVSGVYATAVAQRSFESRPNRTITDICRGLAAKATLGGGEHGFTLIVEGDVESRLDDLHEAGCDDATFRTANGGAVWYTSFEREAPTREEALRFAVADVESVGGLRARFDGRS